MSLIDSAFNLASEIARLVPGYGTLAGAAIDVARNVWNIAEPIVTDVATAAVNGSDLNPQQQGWALNAIANI